MRMIWNLQHRDQDVGTTVFKMGGQHMNSHWNEFGEAIITPSEEPENIIRHLTDKSTGEDGQLYKELLDFCFSDDPDRDMTDAEEEWAKAWEAHQLKTQAS